MRKLNYAEAIREALHQACGLCDDVVVLGQLVDYKSGIFGTTTGLVEAFGPQRVQNMPVAEAMMTSAAIGTAIAGMRPVVVHQRLDFMLYSVDAIANWLSLWRFKSNGKSSAPVTIRAIVGKGWGQGPQHSKSLHAWFAHLPGLRVAMPSTAYDAKGLLLESIFSEAPAVFIEHRGLFSMTDQVPETPYRVRFGKAAIRRSGSDITIVASGWMMPLALRAAEALSQERIDTEVIDPRTISPLDLPTICESVYKTRRLLVLDPAWAAFGVAGEIIASICEELGDRLVAKPVRIALPDSHTPMSSKLESEYYPNEIDVIAKVRSLFKQQDENPKSRGRHNRSVTRS